MTRFKIHMDQMTSLGYSHDSFHINPSHFVYCVYENQYMPYIFDILLCDTIDIRK